MTRRQLIETITAVAEPVYGIREAGAIARLLAEKRHGLTRADIALDPDAELPPGDGFDGLLADLAASRPVQYILGTADFYGLELAVGEGVLIPRPETEELVRWIIDDTRDALDVREDFGIGCNEAHDMFSRKPTKILDVGTGSGAIAIALAKNLPSAHVTAIDVSPEALRYADRNNRETGTGVTLIEADILYGSFDPGPMDIIVSNPPYIPSARLSQMHYNVTKYEPETALFVPDTDPLVFYRAIARLAHRILTPQGALYFEIYETMAREVVGLLKNEGFREVALKEDINSKPRMVRCLS